MPIQECIMNKGNFVIGLGAVSLWIGGCLFIQERNYHSRTGNELANVLQWFGISQVLVGVAVVLIGLEMRKK